MLPEEQMICSTKCLFLIMGNGQIGPKHLSLSEIPQSTASPLYALLQLPQEEVTSL